MNLDHPLDLRNVQIAAQLDQDLPDGFLAGFILKVSVSLKLDFTDRCLGRGSVKKAGLFRGIFPGVQQALAARARRRKYGNTERG